MKKIEEFLEALNNDEEMAEKIKAALEEAEVKNEEEKTDILVKKAQEMGYEVSVEDFAKLSADAQKLDDDELAFASGGGRDSLNWCWSDRGCMFLIKST